MNPLKQRALTALRPADTQGAEPGSIRVNAQTVVDLIDALVAAREFLDSRAENAWANEVLNQVDKALEGAK